MVKHCTIHSWKYGIQRQLKRFIDIDMRVILPEIPGDLRVISKKDADIKAF